MNYYNSFVNTIINHALDKKVKIKKNNFLWIKIFRNKRIKGEI